MNIRTCFILILGAIFSLQLSAQEPSHPQKTTVRLEPPFKVDSVFRLTEISKMTHLSGVKHLSRKPEEKRNAYLKQLAREVVLNCGPEWYREYGEWEVTGPFVYEMPSADLARHGRKHYYYYKVTSQYDRNVETLNWDFASQVKIWEDDGQPEGVTFGTGMGRGFTRLSYKEYLDSTDITKRTGFPYYPWPDAMIWPTSIISSHLSQDETFPILKDLAGRTAARVEQMSGKGVLDSIFTKPLLTMTGFMRILTRPVYTMDSVTFMNFTVDKDLSQCMKRDETRLGCILCYKDMVLSYALYERTGASEWTYLPDTEKGGWSSPELRVGKGVVGSFLDDVVLSHDELFFFVWPEVVYQTFQGVNPPETQLVFHYTEAMPYATFRYLLRYVRADGTIREEQVHRSSLAEDIRIQKMFVEHPGVMIFE